MKKITSMIFAMIMVFGLIEISHAEQDKDEIRFRGIPWLCDAGEAIRMLKDDLGDDVFPDEYKTL